MIFIRETPLTGCVAKVVIFFRWPAEVSSNGILCRLFVNYYFTGLCLIYMDYL
jgi:hypothetical protein